MRVVDFCAGAGGKTLALAAHDGEQGADRRLRRAAGRLERARPCACNAPGVHNVERVPLASERDPWVKRHAAASTACWSTRPAPASAPGGATRMRNGASTPERLAELTQLQARILDSAARLVKPGGRLVYATCSLLPEENEAQVAAFLAAHAQFAQVSVAELWASAAPRDAGARLGADPDPDPRKPRHRRLLPRGAGAQDRMTGGVIIRPARVGDEPGIAAVHWAARRRAYEGLLPRENLDGRTVEVLTEEWIGILKREDGAETLVAEEAEGRILGFATGGPVLDRKRPVFGDLSGVTAEVSLLYVHPERKGEGIGRALLARAVGRLAGFGHQALVVWGYRGNPFLDFYERLAGRGLRRKRRGNWRRAVCDARLCLARPQVADRRLRARGRPAIPPATA